jgi:hypothetical protein
MADDWMGQKLFFQRRHAWRDETLAKLEYYESEYGRLKETTSILELAISKRKINDGSKDLCETMGGGNKKIKRDGPEFRLQCRISCGADHVVESVWPYLLPSDYVRAYVYSSDEEDDDNADSDDNTGEEDNDNDC